ncbi:MAG: hypothetical protein ACJATA_000242 [Sphingobacteriales bacterium]|jgi:hypothetical protein
MIKLRAFFGLFILALVVLASCRKPTIVSDDPSFKLNFSEDTVFFDTVFTTVGSTTQRFKIFNPNKQAVRISKINLGGGSTSPFRLNVDGLSGKLIKDLEIAGEDSAFVFTEVTIDPTPGSMPFVVSDSIQFETNGNLQQVQLVSWGQNANFLRDSILPCNTTWTSELPYVIYNSVLVNSGCRLNIEKGARIYNHKGSSIFVLGTISAQGTRNDSIIFQTDRLEKYLDDEPGQWNGIHFLRGSLNNFMNYTVVKNALIGLRVDSLPVDGSANFNLQIYNSTIKHHQIAGILGITGRIRGFNNLIYNCGQFAIAGLLGGAYDFRHNTIGNFNFLFNRKDPSLVLTDNFDTGTELLVSDLTGIFVNNIIWGSLKNEISINNDGGTTPILAFDYNIIRTEDSLFNNTTNFINEDPLFINAFEENYHLDSLSPAREKGVDITVQSSFLVRDKDQVVRKDPPSIGCFEN